MDWYSWATLVPMGRVETTSFQCILMLEHEDISALDTEIYPGISSFSCDSWVVGAASSNSKEKIDAKMERVIQAMGVKAAAGPGWRLVVAHNQYG